MALEFDPTRIEVIDDASAAMYRKMPAAERVNIACDLVEFAWEVVKSGVRHQYPEWDESAIERETDRRFRLASD
jgi:hypothetical protein